MKDPKNKLPDRFRKLARQAKEEMKEKLPSNKVPSRFKRHILKEPGTVGCSSCRYGKFDEQMGEYKCIMLGHRVYGGGHACQLWEEKL